MTHRLESVAVGACRRLLGRSQSSLRRSHLLLVLRSDASISTSTVPTAAAPQLITSSRIRPASMASLSNTIIAGSHYRQYHFTTTTRNSEGGNTPTPAAPAAAASVNTAPFASPKVEALFQKILWLDMVEIHLLAELINEKLGITISDAERERMARGGGGGGKRGAGGDDAPAAAEAVEEKTIFDIKLTGFDAKNKIKVIKEVRALTNLGLKEAKELVEGVPATLKKNVKKEEAEELKAKLAELGAQVDIV